MTEAATGPLDVSAYLADVRAGKRAPRRVTVQIYLDAEAVEEANSLVEQINAAAANPGAEASITDDVPDAVAELEARWDALQDRCQPTPFVFRSQHVGDQAEVDKAMKAAGDSPDDPELRMVYWVALFCESPKITPDEVKQLPDLIGWGQFNRLAGAVQRMLLEVPRAPLSPRPSRGRGITTR